MDEKRFYSSQGKSKSYLRNYCSLVKTNWEESQEYKHRIEREKIFLGGETVGLDSFSMILFIKIESSCHNINFLQFTFIKHGTQAFSTNYYFPIFITSFVPQQEDGVRRLVGGKRDEGWKSEGETMFSVSWKLLSSATICSMK